MKKITLADCLPDNDEARSYHGVYGDLFFEVPHYVKSYTVTADTVSVRFANGTICEWLEIDE